MDPLTDVLAPGDNLAQFLVVARGPCRPHECVLYLDGLLRTPLNGALRHSVEDLLRRGERRIVLDLARVRSIDAGGIGQLVRAYNLTMAAGGVLRIVRAAPWVREMLERAGLFTLLTDGRD
jgi:anti-anti-sigma factor